MQHGEARPPLAKRAWDELTSTAKSILFFLPFYFAFTTAALGNYTIPSESMVPALEVGDRIVVSKWAYGYSRFSIPLRLGAMLPHSGRRLLEKLPRRGDVVVFVHPRTGVTLIKRVIGLPGDRIETRDKVLHVNGAPVQVGEGAALRRRAHQSGVEDVVRYEEALPSGVRYPVHQFPDHGTIENFGPLTVPERHVFFMGDNRDNSLDSRWIGMGPVPIENLIGRAELVYFAAPACRAEYCTARDRWLKPLHD
jgi:signal peptidase I